ncbi:MAG TPA: FtsX-like permease family protein [Micromonosporaceae bacterium]|jgi:putative ABC transport system permease protein
MSAMTHKALRDLRRQGPQVTAVAVTIMLGVMLYIASAGAFRNLSDSYEHTYDRLSFADLVADGGDTGALTAAARAHGASAVQARTQADSPLLIDGTKLVGRLVGLPAPARPTVDNVDVVRGDYLSPDAPDGVLVERHAADTFGLAVGDQLQVFTAGGWHSVVVRGVVVSAEYLWPARDRQDVLSDPHGFAVVFAAESQVRQWAGTGPNQVLVRLADRPASSTVDTAADALRAAGAVNVTLRSQQASQATLQEDLDGFSEISIAFPLLFLIAAAVAAYVILARRVLAERPVIGALMASGARRGRLVRHFLLQGFLVGLVGGAAGVALGMLATGAITSAYTGELGIPDTIVSQHPDLAVAGLAVALVVGFAGAAAPALTAARTAPAEAMRNAVVVRPPGWWSRLVGHLRALPATWRMALRDVFRSARRTLATMLGAILALVLVLGSIGMMTSILAALRVQYGQVDRQDATISVDPTSVDTVRAALQNLAGIATVERVWSGPVTASHDGHSYATVLSGYQPATQMHGFRTASGEPVDLPADGVLAGQALRGQLDIEPGETLTLSTVDGRTAIVRLVGFVDEPIGTSLYMSEQAAQALVPDALVGTLAVRFDAGTDRDQMRATVTGLPGVVAYADTAAVASSLDQFLGLFWAFIAIMVALGAILAFAIIYVMMTVNTVERTNELATLRAAGVPVRRVAGTLVTENLIATVLGIPIGLVLGVLVARGLLDTFSNDLFQFHLDLSWWALLLAAFGVLLAALASQAPAARAVRRLDIARVVRERAA